ncbi:Imm50 family immunity protein [Actinopolyspora mortivallis]|uniref:Imm50 family immunity protein n=1 Tax=Actinopolyspora mortivallis TaxID=33906 RepID=UPI0012ED678C
MSWPDLVLHTEGIRAIYGDHVPTLDGITLREVVIDHERSSTILTFDLPELPETMPKKWAQKGADSVRLKLDFFPPSPRVGHPRDSGSASHRDTRRSSLHVRIEHDTTAHDGETRPPRQSIRIPTGRRMLLLA